MSDMHPTASVELFRYETSELRSVVIDGEPWFVAVDVARILEYSATSAMTRRLDDEDKGVRDLHTLGGNQKLIVISEAGFYAAILGSQSAKSRVIKRWLTHDVLPTIRKTGQYSTAPTLTGPELMATALLEAAATLKAKDQQIAELEAPARAWNNLADAKGNYSVAEAAKILSQDSNISIGRDRLFDFMHSKRWIFRSRNPRGGWEARQEQVDTGRLYERPARPFLNSKSGEYELPAPTLRVTVKGIAKLHELLGGSGQLSLSEAA
ncbi:phage antirepressor [Rhodococcus sp. NPDC056960]|uniref:phage antirepressor n=1 Tax=Rhodococcus sp. NPDC056960 TaxID=3345982 RepID=UPI003630BBCD